MGRFKHLAPATLTTAIMLASGFAVAAESSGDGQANNHKADSYKADNYKAKNYKADNYKADNYKAKQHQSIPAAIKAGSAKLSYRLRHEDVDIDNASEDQARALTLRTRLNYTTGRYQGFGATVEVDNVTEISGDDYPTSPALKNSGDFPGKAIIADPEGTELNQAYISYKYGTTEGKYGRQRINLDNQRFIGGVGFRQNEQTYDAVSIAHSCEELNTSVYYAHINNVNRIFGEDDPALSDTDSSTDILNINYSGLAAGDIIFYSYLLDQTLSNTQLETYGLRFAGKSYGLGYQAEYATQERELASGSEADADYVLLEGSIDMAGATFALGLENLQSDEGDFGFSTPLATGHKFQGWADQFLITPDEGIQDIYLSVGAKFDGIKLLAIYHDFKSDEDNVNGDDDLGSEVGFLALKDFGDYKVSVKYANYDAGNDSFNKSDTEKLWLTVSGAF